MPTLHGNLLPPPSSVLKLEPARSSEKSIVPHSMRQQPWTLTGAGKAFQRRTLRTRRWASNLFSLSWSASYPSFTHQKHPLSLLQDPAAEV